VLADRRRLLEERGYNAAVMEEWPALIFSNFRNAHPVTGSATDLAAATLADVTAFYRTYYSPGNAVLAIAGDFQAADAKKLVEQYFGGPASPPPPAMPDLSEPPRIQGKTKVVQDARIGAPALVLGWRAPGRRSPEWYAVQFLDAILTDGQTARIQMDLIEGRRSLLQVQSGIGWPFDSAQGAGDPAEYTIYALYRPGLRPESIVNEIQQEIETIATIGLTESDMRRVRAAVRLENVTTLQSSLERAALLAQYALLEPPAPGVKSAPAGASASSMAIDRDFVALMEVTAEQVQSVAKKLLTQTRRDVLFIEAPRPVRLPAGKK
jgi:predicted Zn-dependent peptidase